MVREIVGFFGIVPISVIVSYLALGLLIMGFETSDAEGMRVVRCGFSKLAPSQSSLTSQVPSIDNAPKTNSNEASISSDISKSESSDYSGESFPSASPNSLSKPSCLTKSTAIPSNSPSTPETLAL